MSVICRVVPVQKAVRKFWLCLAAHMMFAEKGREP